MQQHPSSLSALCALAASLCLVLAVSAANLVAAQNPAPQKHGPTAKGHAHAGPNKIIGYFTEWGIYARNFQPSDIPAEKITHLNYAFANIGSDLLIAQGDPYAATQKYYPGDVWNQPYLGNYNQINNVIKPQHPHLKTFISVGGWTWSGRFSDVALTASNRAAFATSCVDFIRQFNFDGVDIDWEYPGGGGLGSNTVRPEDGRNYTLLMAELRQQLDAASAQDGRRYLLTIAAGAGYDKMANYEMFAISQQLDWINVMTYDFRGAWDLTSTAHHSAFDPNPADQTGNPEIASKYNAHWAMDALAAAGVPRHKLVMGVPFYGRAWGGVPAANGGLFQPATHVPAGTWDDWQSGATGVNDYTEIEGFLVSGAYTRWWDPISQATYAYSPVVENGHFISFEDVQSLQVKLDYLRRGRFGGVMFWEFSSDRNHTLLDAIRSGIR